MILHQKGNISDGLYVLGHPAVPVYLLDGPNPVLFDAGITCLSRRYIEDIEACLGGRQPSYCFLTHAHFDHCGALAAFKKAFPRLQTAASAAAKQILNRPTAVAQIRRLNRAATRMIHPDGTPADDAEDFESVDIDRTLHDGERISISSQCTVEVMATPGHTRDCLSFYVPEKKLLFSSEAAGQADQTGYIVSDCLADYDQYRSSLGMLSRLEVEILCPGHIFVYTAESARDYMARALDACIEFRQRVERLADEEHGDIGRLMARIKSVEYDPKPGPKQPEPAYSINLEARIKAVLKARDASHGAP